MVVYERNMNFLHVYTSLWKVKILPQCQTATALMQYNRTRQDIASFAVGLPIMFLITSHRNKLKVLHVSHQVQDKSVNARGVSFFISYLTDM